MNKERRTKINDLLKTLSDVKSQLETLVEEERDAQENKPEALQNFDATEALESADGNLENCIDDLEGIE